MTRSTLVTASLALIVGAPAALGQIVTTVPPATPPAPPYTPPAPPPAAPPAPAAPAVATPDLVKKDAAGKAIPLTEPAEFVAIDALNLPADRKAKIDLVKTQRRAMMDGTLIKNASDAVLVRSKLATLDKAEFNDLVGLQKPLQGLMLKERYIDMLVQGGAISQAEATAARDAVTNYGRAMQEALKEAGGNDIMKTAALSARYNIRTNSREAMVAFEEMLTKLAAKLGKSPDEAATALGAASADDQMKMLVPVATPMPMTIEPVKPAGK